MAVNLEQYGLILCFLGALAIAVDGLPKLINKLRNLPYNNNYKRSYLGFFLLALGFALQFAYTFYPFIIIPR